MMAMMRTPLGAMPGKGHCGVVALAAVTNSDVSAVEEFMRDLFYGGSRRWRGCGVYPEQIPLFLDYFGYEYSGWHRPKERDTLYKWVEFKSYPRCRYIVSSRDHMVAVEDGIVVDQAGAALVSDFWRKRMIVKRVLGVRV